MFEYPPEYDIYPDDNDDHVVVTIAHFMDHIGVDDSLSRTLRAIAKYNDDPVWLELADGRRLYPYTDRLDEYPTDLRVTLIGVGDRETVDATVAGWAVTLDDVRG